VFGPYGECAKPINQALLVQRLAIGLEPPSNSCCSESVNETRRLAAMVDPPSDHFKQRILKALGTWWNAFPTWRSGSLMRLALCVLRQAIP